MNVCGATIRPFPSHRVAELTRRERLGERDSKLIPAFRGFRKRNFIYLLDTFSSPFVARPKPVEPFVFEIKLGRRRPDDYIGFPNVVRILYRFSQFA